jgi:hypothetical protein
MVKEVATEIGKLAVARLSEVKAEDAARAVKALGQSSVGAVLLVPGLGTFVAGLALGAGLGVLLAPRSGRETRGLIKRAWSARLESFRERRQLLRR